MVTIVCSLSSENKYIEPRTAMHAHLVVGPELMSWLWVEGCLWCQGWLYGWADCKARVQQLVVGPDWGLGVVQGLVVGLGLESCLWGQG